MTDSEAMALIGASDRNLNTLADCLGVHISFRDNQFLLQDCTDEQYEAAGRTLRSLCRIVEKNTAVLEQDVIYLARLAMRNEDVDVDQLSGHIVGRTLSGKVIAPKTKGQLRFVKAMEKNPIVFAVGPAGTGKTFLAVIHAVTELKKGNIKRIVLTRPAVEAGENLGFLPGDLKEKVDPYLTPLYDALHDMLGTEQTEKFMEKGVIEIAPLAYMRGRTLDDSYVILDEAQNTTTSQMKMFLTRLGFRSRMVITGDITQIDLNVHTRSGLVEAVRILRNIPDIAILELTADDVVRHPLVQKIIERYAENEKE
jgi:phosphate starvation-inducible PhoH-like protein